MYIDDFIWLPDFIEKLILNTMSHRMRLKRYFSTAHGTVLSNQVIQRAKIYIQPVDKLMRVGI